MLSSDEDMDQSLGLFDYCLPVKLTYFSYLRIITEKYKIRALQL
jgi:hypothetical protein